MKQTANNMADSAGNWAGGGGVAKRDRENAKGRKPGPKKGTN